MLKVQANSRQVPKHKDYISNSKYCDYLYGYLQAASQWDGVIGHPRFIYKKSINFSRIATDLGKSRQTISTKFKNLEKGDVDHGVLPLIRLSEDGTKYELIYLEGNLAMLVPELTLKVLVSTFNEHTISVYVYLLNRYYASQCKGFQFSFPELKSAIGISQKSHGNNYIISSILLILQRAGLLELESKTLNTDKGLIKTHYFVKWMTNDIEEVPEEWKERERALFQNISR